MTYVIVLFDPENLDPNREPFLPEQGTIGDIQVLGEFRTQRDATIRAKQLPRRCSWVIKKIVHRPR